MRHSLIGFAEWHWINKTENTFSVIRVQIKLYSYSASIWYHMRVLYPFDGQSQAWRLHWICVELLYPTTNHMNLVDWTPSCCCIMHGICQINKTCHEFSAPWITFAAEYRVVMYTSCSRLSWCYYCDVNLYNCDVRYHGSIKQ